MKVLFRQFRVDMRKQFGLEVQTYKSLFIRS